MAKCSKHVPCSIFIRSNSVENECVTMEQQYNDTNHTKELYSQQKYAENNTNSNSERYSARSRDPITSITPNVIYGKNNCCITNETCN